MAEGMGSYMVELIITLLIRIEHQSEYFDDERIRLMDTTS